MVIKKYTDKQNQTTREERLAAYARNGRSFLKTRPARNLSDSLKKGTLAAIIPLAAAGSVSAQCLGSITLVIAQNGQQSFDVDGDGGNDLQLSHKLRTFSTTYGSTYTYPDLLIKPLGGGLYIRGAYANLLPVTGTVTRGQPNFANTAKRLCIGSSIGNFCVDDGARYAAVRKGNGSTGSPGWIHIQTTVFNNSGATVKILKRGIESPNNPNTNLAAVGDCSSNAEGIDAAPLPVEMLYFNTKADQDQITLEWATATEQENSGFEVQRSTDGRFFGKIGWVPGAGNSVEQHRYSFADTEVQSNTNYYYRLKQVDFDGTSEFSPVRSMMIENSNLFAVGELFPNPVNQEYGFSMFKLHVPEEGAVDIKVFDLKGTLVKELTKSFPKGQATLSVPVADMADGQYYVKLQLGKQVEYRRLVVN